MVLCEKSKKEKRKKEMENAKREQKEERKEILKGEKKQRKNEANMRSGRRPSPEGTVAVCWYDQSYDMSS